jgi:hypothetical protein
VPGAGVRNPEFKERSVQEYRAKFEAMKSKAEIAAADGDEAGRLSYHHLANGWAQMIEHAKRRGRTGARD